MLTIHECPECGDVTAPRGTAKLYCVGNQNGPEPYPDLFGDHQGAEMLRVRVFTEDEVRPLWDALRAVKGELESGTRDSARYVLSQPPFSDADAFPAPEEWTR